MAVDTGAIKPPLISLVLTVYNRQHYLAETLTSILNQTYANFELILWDDGSTDDTLAIAQSYANQDPRIRLFPSPHQGRVLSLQAAHAQAQGDYLGWVDSDDLLASTALAETLQVLLQHPQSGFVYTNYITIDEQGDLMGPGQRCQVPFSLQRMLIDFITFHFRLFRRDLFEQAGGIDTSFPAAIDYDLCLRLCELTPVCHLPRPLYAYRVHSQSISGAQKPLQVQYAQQAIQNALHRRGLAETYEIIVEDNKFSLRQKSVL